jgi:hypothetical protein
MARRYLFGPVKPAFADQNLRRQRQAGDCLAFDETGATDLAIGPFKTWDEVCRRFPAGWQPDCVVLSLAYTSIPGSLLSAPVPVIGLAADWNLQWHYYRRRLRDCDLVLTDTLGVETLHREGILQARPANLFGGQRDWLDAPRPERPRDIDVIFVGNLHEAVQRERLPWLARLASLGSCWRVWLGTGIFGEDYQALLGRSRIAFNRSIRGECNQRTFEAAAAGALLFQEAGNREVATYFRDRQECIYYTPENLESLLAYYLEHEEERLRIAEAARAKVRQFTFENLWDDHLALIEREWPEITQRARQRLGRNSGNDLRTRIWQGISSTLGTDPTLAFDLADALTREPLSAEWHNALGLVEAIQATGQGSPRSLEQVAVHFRQAWETDPLHVVAGLNLAEVWVRLQYLPQAVAQARRVLEVLDLHPQLHTPAFHAGHFPTSFDHFRVEWERAAWSHAGQPDAEAKAKRQLLRWRLHTLLADLTGDLAHYEQAALARPDLPLTQAALGCALGRGGRPADAVPPLRKGVAGNPFDLDAARALFHALGDVGDHAGQQQLAHTRQLLARAAPQLVPPEAWFLSVTQGRSASDGMPSLALRPGMELSRGRCIDAVPALPTNRKARVSLCMIVKNEEGNLPLCLASAAPLVNEVVVVDTGSTDGTKAVAAQFQARVFDFPWVDSFAAARNESLRHATGDWIFWLDADDRLDEANQGRLAALFANLTDENLAFSMKCVCLPDPHSNSSTVVDHVRLFRNDPGIRWQYRVHEQILPAIRQRGGEVRAVDILIHHAGYQDPALSGHKHQRNLRLLHLDQADHPDDPFIRFIRLTRT